MGHDFSAVELPKKAGRPVCFRGILGKRSSLIKIKEEDSGSYKSIFYRFSKLGEIIKFND
jgi:hypothetical protein